MCHYRYEYFANCRHQTFSLYELCLGADALIKVIVSEHRTSRIAVHIPRQGNILGPTVSPNGQSLRRAVRALPETFSHPFTRSISSNTLPQARPFCIQLGNIDTGEKYDGEELMSEEHDEFGCHGYSSQGDQSDGIAPHSMSASPHSKAITAHTIAYNGTYSPFRITSQGEGTIGMKLRGGAASGQESLKGEDCGEEDISSTSSYHANTISFVEATGMSWADEVELEEAGRSVQVPNQDTGPMPSQKSVAVPVSLKPEKFSWADEVEEEEEELRRNVTSSEKTICKPSSAEHPKVCQQTSLHHDEVGMEELRFSVLGQDSSSEITRVQEGVFLVSPKSLTSGVKVADKGRIIQEMGASMNDETKMEGPVLKKEISSWVEGIDMESEESTPLMASVPRNGLQTTELYSADASNLRGSPWSFDSRIDIRKDWSRWRGIDRQSPRMDEFTSTRMYRPAKERMYRPPKDEDLPVEGLGSLHKSNNPWQPKAVSQTQDKKIIKASDSDLKKTNIETAKAIPLDDASRDALFSPIFQDLRYDPQNGPSLKEEVSSIGESREQSSIGWSVTQSSTDTEHSRELSSQDKTLRIKHLITALFAKPSSLSPRSTPIRWQGDVMSRPRASSMIMSRILPAIDRRTTSDRRVTWGSSKQAGKELAVSRTVQEFTGDPDGGKIIEQKYDTCRAAEDMPVAREGTISRAQSDDGPNRSVMKHSPSPKDTYTGHGNGFHGKVIPLAKPKHQTIDDKVLDSPSPFSLSPVLRATLVSEGNSSEGSLSDASTQPIYVSQLPLADPFVECSKGSAQPSGSASEQKRFPRPDFKLSLSARSSTTSSNSHEESPTLRLGRRATLKTEDPAVLSNELASEKPAMSARNTCEEGNKEFKAEARWRKYDTSAGSNRSDAQKDSLLDGVNEPKSGEFRRGRTTDIWKIVSGDLEDGDGWQTVKGKGDRMSKAAHQPKQIQHKDSKPSRGRRGRKVARLNRIEEISHPIKILPDDSPLSELDSETRPTTQGPFIKKGLSCATVANPLSPDSVHSSMLSSEANFVSAPQSPLKPPIKSRWRSKQHKGTQDYADSSDEEYFSAPETTHAKIRVEIFHDKSKLPGSFDMLKPESFSEKTKPGTISNKPNPHQIIYDKSKGLDPTSPPFQRRQPPTPFSMMRSSFSAGSAGAAISMVASSPKGLPQAPRPPRPAPASLSLIPRNATMTNPSTHVQTPDIARAEGNPCSHSQLQQDCAQLFLRLRHRQQPATTYTRLTSHKIRNYVRHVRPCGVFHIEKAVEVLTRWCPSCESR